MAQVSGESARGPEEVLGVPDGGVASVQLLACKGPHPGPFLTIPDGEGGSCICWSKKNAG